MRGVIGCVSALVLLGAIVTTAAQLPPEILADRYLVEAEKLIAAKEPGKALEAMNKIIALQQKHNLTLPDVFHFKYAELALSVGSFQTAIDSVNKYLGTAGRDGEFYREALELLVQAEQEEERRRQEEARRRQEEARRKQEEARRKQIRPILPEMVEVPSGRFRMGCGKLSSGSQRRIWGEGCKDVVKCDVNCPEHEVRVGAFELGKYEVTFEEYDRFTDATGRPPTRDRGWGRGRRPVMFVPWEDAVAYTRWLSSKTGRHYRLPSEAEWEYAARAGSKKKYSWGNKIGRNRANCIDCGSRWDKKQTAPVGSFGPNSWGLHDMHGNVSEWVQDCWNKTYQGAPADGTAWERGDCSRRVLRGGSWGSWAGALESAGRDRERTADRDEDAGFRVARTVTP